MKKSFNIQELLHRKSKHHGAKPMHPASSKAFQRHQGHNLNHPGLVDLISTTQNKIPSFIDRFFLNRILFKFTLSLSLLSPPIPSFNGIHKGKNFLLNPSIKC
jgi:hypothetical protein